MGITDELRKWKGNIQTCLAPEVVLQLRCELNDIADRIDMEHQKAIRELNNLADASVLLPVDADGVPIHIGDRVEDNERVVRIVITDGSWEPSVYIEKLPNVLHEYFCNEVSHYHKPTVDDVLREFAEKVIDSQVPNVHPTYEEAIAEYAKRLRLVGEDE